DVTIAAIGSMVNYALIAAETLSEKKVSAKVLNVHTLKPLDKATLVKSAKKTGRVISAEQHQVNGGLGGAIAEVLSENYPTPVKRMGVNDVFSETARELNQLLEHHELTAADIVANAQKLIEKTRK
ncbi:transketolase C-terminal domain-containing protein, partial [Thermoproteota archaeon]